MLDVDFILSPKAKVKTHLIHTYKEACFRFDVRRTAITIAEQNSWLWLEVDLEQFDLQIWSPSLYGELVLAIDLDELSASYDAPKKVASLLAAMREQKEKHFFLQGRPGSLTSLDAWKTLLEVGLHLTEPEDLVVALPSLLYFVNKRTNESLATVTNKSALEKEIKAWLPRGRPDLLTFLTWLDMVMTVCVHPESRVFDLIQFEALVRDSKRRNPYEIYDALAAFLVTPLEVPRLKLLNEIDRSFHKIGMDSRMVLNMMERTTEDLTLVNNVTNPAGTIPSGWGDFRWRKIREHRQVPATLLLKWHVLLSHAEPRLRHGGVVAWSDLLAQMA